MRTARLSALTALVLSVTGALPLVTSAQATTADLYVDRANASCSDGAADAGSQTTPFCTISAAAAVVQPGQTVHVSNRIYTESVHLTRSGTPGAPITFVSTKAPSDFVPAAEVQGTTGHAFVLDGVHDVTIRSMNARAGQEAVVVTGSSQVTLDRDTLYSSGWNSTATTRYPSLRITGQSSNVTVSRTRISSSRGDAIDVDAGVTKAVITTNEILSNDRSGITVTDAPGTVVTSNSIEEDCGPAITLAGNSSGASIENNELAEITTEGGVWGPCPSTGRVDLSVSAASAAGTKVDYNVVASGTPTPYSWAGQTYADVASFQTATGQGAHDLTAAAGQLPGGSQSSPSIDSADATAPGELDTDIDGLPRVDDPNIQNAGTGAGYYDRGAHEVQDPLSVSLNVAPSTLAGHPLNATVNGSVNKGWVTPTVSVDFGDGSAPVSSPAFPLEHTYPGPGTYTVTLTATDPYAGTQKSSGPVTIQPVGPLTAGLMLDVPNTDPMSIGTDLSGTKSPWPVAKETVDFGDGTVVDTDQAKSGPSHTYKVAGTYTIGYTVTDDHGRTDSTSRTYTAGSDYQPLASPVRLLDTRSGLGAAATPVGPGGVLKLQVTGRAGVPTDGSVTAVLLNLTATDSTDSTFVTAFPGTGPVPNASNLNVTPGHDVGNAVLVPVAPDGTVSLYNHLGNVDLVADVQGYFTTKPQGPALGLGFQKAPVRVLDTRSGIGGINQPVGPGQMIRFRVTGPDKVAGIAQVVVLNLTATGGTENSYVTADPNGNPPTNSSLNFAAGQTVANQVTVPVDADGMVTLYNHAGTVNLIADAQNYYASMGGSPVVTTAPTRLLDTRSGIGGSSQKLGPDSAVKVKVAGVAGVPAGVSSVVVNLTATDPTDVSWLNAYASGSPVRSTSNVNVTPGATVPNLAVVPVGPDGCIEIYNHSGSTNVVVDLQGYNG